MSAEAAESPTRLAVDVRRFPWIRRLAADYTYNFPAVARFFAAGDPAERTAWARAIAAAQSHDRHRDAIAQVVARQQEQRGAPAPAAGAGRQLADPRTVAVVTGQQAGLFGGPLYTLLKAVSAIQLAREISRLHNVPAVPIFWIEGEDHDWNEVRTCTVFDESLTPHAIALPQELMIEPCPVASVRLDQSAASAVDRLEQTLPATEFRPSLVDALRQIYAPGSGMADAFGRWIEHVLGPHGLIVYDASDPDGKSMVKDVFTRELSTAGETARRAARIGAELESNGYHSQVPPQDDTVGLFVLDGGRQAIRQRDGRFTVGEHIYSSEALVQEAAEHPAGFSPNVLLRPIVQDTLFPTAAYVAGPNELAYLGQLRGVYEHFGIPMPIIYQRATATLVDSGALRFLTKYNQPVEALQRQDDAALNALLASQIPPVVESRFSAAASAIEDSLASLIEVMPALDPTLEGAAKSTLVKLQLDLESLHKKIIQAAKRRDETLRRQFQRTKALVFPNGEPQEREIGFVAFLNQYGPALVERLIAELPLEPGKHWVISI